MVRLLCLIGVRLCRSYGHYAVPKCYSKGHNPRTVYARIGRVNVRKSDRYISETKQCKCFPDRWEYSSGFALPEQITLQQSDFTLGHGAMADDGRNCKECVLISSSRTTVISYHHNTHRLRIR